MSLWDEDFGPMLLKETDKLIKSNDYLYEIKFDGIRAFLFINKGSIKIISRNKKDITHLFPELLSIGELFKKKTIIDGEIICTSNGRISFETISERMHLKSKDKIKSLSRENPALFVAFDILYCDKELIDLPLEQRKKFLNKFKENDFFIKSRIYYDSIKLFDFVKKNNLEGIVAKLKNSKYLINTRSYNWIKIKNYHVNDFFIGGYEEKKGNYISLKLGECKKNKLVFVGSVSLIKRHKLYNEILKLKRIKTSPFTNYSENIIYVETKLKCRVRYIEKTKNNQLRQPIIVKE